MSGPDELDRALGQLRAEREPPQEIQGRVYASLLAKLGDGGDDGGPEDWDERPDAPEPAGPGEALGGAASGKAAALHVVKIIGATAAMTAGGLLVLALGARAMPRSDAPPEPPASIEAPARSQAPARSPEPAESAPAPAQRTQPSDSSDRAPTKQARPRLERAPPSDPPAPTSTSAELQSPDSLAAEVAMLDAARRTPAGPRRLAKLDAHAQRFPAGALADERDALWAVTSCELGDLDAGRARARALIERRPQSPLLPRVRAVCPGLSKSSAQN